MYRLLPWRLRRVLPRVHRVRLDRENCGGLALGVGVFLAGLGLLREVLLVLCFQEENALFSLSALVSDVEEPHHGGEGLGVDAELLEHPVVGDAFFEGRDDYVVGDVRDLVADLAEPLDVLAEGLARPLLDDTQIVVRVGTLVHALEVGDKLPAQLGLGVDGVDRKSVV